MKVEKRLLFLATILLVALDGSYLEAQSLTGSVGIIQRPTGPVLSAGAAEYRNALGSIDWNVRLSLRHRIIDTANGFMLVDRYPVAWGEYVQSVEGNPQPNRCYRGKLDATTDSLEGHWDSAETVCALSKELPDEEQTDCETSECGTSPIVLDLAGDGFRFTGLDQPVHFDLDQDGVAETLSWTDPAHDEAFLALDRNGNGRIDNGSELFGDATPQPPSDERNGYRALAMFDDNGDRHITPADASYDSLMLWRDQNHDGVSQPYELQPLADSSIRSIDLDYVTSRRRDRHGNELRWSSLVDLDGQSRFACTDVLFLRQAP